MSEPVPGQLSRRPVVGHALQFDGTVDGLLKIFNLLSGNTDNVFMGITFGPNGTIREARFSGPVNFALNNRDWVIVPSDGSSMMTITHEQYLSMWTPEDDSPPAAQGRRKR